MTRLRSFPKAAIIVLLFLVPLLPIPPASASPICSPSQSPSWQICGPITAVSGVNEQPSAVQASDGTLRLAWTHLTTTGASSIDYAVRFANGTWQSPSSVTNLGGQNEFPSIIQHSNGTIFVFWSYKAVGANHFQIYYRYLKGTVWSTYRPLPLNGTQTSLNDTLASTAVDRSGTLWLAWTRDNTTAAGTTAVMRQLWYKTLGAAGWSTELNITSPRDVNWNLQPSIASGKDGVMRIAYSRGQSPSFQINYVYRSSSGWSSPVPVSSSNSTANDQSPSLIQDRNGTFRVFWTRNTNPNLVIRTESSIDNGVHWGGETAINSACSACSSDRPSAVQSITDKNIWVFYTNTSSTSTNIWALKTSSPIFPVHDVATVCFGYCYLSFAATKMYAGGFPGPYAGQSPIESVYITVRNFGDFIENVTLNLAVTNTTKYLFTQALQVQNNTSATFAFNWNTTGVKPGRYGISANATIPGETVGNQADDNLLLKNQIWLIPLGDVNQDGAVTIVDISIANFGYAATPGNPRWNPYADITGGGIISIVDINYINFHYGIYT